MDKDISRLISKVSLINLNIDRIIRIQSFIKGWIVRHNNKKLKDAIDIDIIDTMLEKYNEKNVFNKKINNLLLKKKIRNENFPSIISENIAKFSLFIKFKIMGCWAIENGDLILQNKKIEVKGFMSKGPLSFGPKEKWDLLCIVDAVRYTEKYFVVYLISIPNNDKIWYSIKVNSTETYLDQCLQKRRPRMCFNIIQKHLGSRCRKIFEGYLNELSK